VRPGRPAGWSQQDVILRALSVVTEYAFSEQDQPPGLEHAVETLGRELDITAETRAADICLRLRDAL
jgi:hypothetical protein